MTTWDLIIAADTYDASECAIWSGGGPSDSPVPWKIDGVVLPTPVGVISSIHEKHNTRIALGFLAGIHPNMYANL